MTLRALVRKYGWGALLIFPALALWKIHPSSVSQIPICSLKRMTGLNCPGCGATRATHYLLNGDIGSAMQYNAMYVALIPVVGLCGLYAFWQHRHPKAPKLPHIPLLIVLGIVLTAFGIARNFPAGQWLNPPRF